MTGLVCPDCKGEEFIQEYAIDDFYVCAKCKKPVAYYCSLCERLFTSNRLGLHGDVYECKLCGKIQWGYTEWKREQVGESR